MNLERKDDYDHKAWMKKEDLIPVEATFLTTLVWLDKRPCITDYLELLETLYCRVSLQMPKSHTEQYNLDNKFWYQYPLYTLGLFSTLAYVVTATSGTLLEFYYSPTTTGDPVMAYNGIGSIMCSLQFDFMLRSVHRWTVQVMVVAALLRMLRVYFTGPYKEPRELNWLPGIILISLTVAFGYTGYPLLWDQLASRAGQVGVKMALPVPLASEWVVQLLLGGFLLGQSTLQRIYIIHVFLLPFVVTTPIAIHIGVVWVWGIAEPH